jgi:hypothetical protein
VGGAGRDVVRGGDGLAGGAVVRCGVAGVPCGAGGVDGASGTVGIDDELAVLPGPPEALVLPLPHAATDATANVTHAVNPILRNDRADMFLTAWHSRARWRDASTMQLPHALALSFRQEP